MRNYSRSVCLQTHPRLGPTRIGLLSAGSWSRFIASDSNRRNMAFVLPEMTGRSRVISAVAAKGFTSFFSFHL